MFSSFYEPLPDINKAMARIGLEGMEIKHDLATLDTLIKAYATHVPYENLQVSIEHTQPSLASKDLFDKIVTRRRGGYCFEMNGFFWLLLRDLGFDIYSVSVYVLEDMDSRTDLGHRSNIIVIDGKKYFAEVGFGGNSAAHYAIPLDGTIRGNFFIKYDEKLREYTLMKIVDPEKEAAKGKGRFVNKEVVEGVEVNCKKIQMFRDFIAYPEEFNLPNIGVFHSVGNPMMELPVCNICNEKGETYTIKEGMFRSKTADGQFERPIKDEKETLELAEKYFGIVL